MRDVVSCLYEIASNKTSLIQKTWFLGSNNDYKPRNRLQGFTPLQTGVLLSIFLIGEHSLLPLSFDLIFHYQKTIETFDFLLKLQNKER